MEGWKQLWKLCLSTHKNVCLQHDYFDWICFLFDPGNQSMFFGPAAPKTLADAVKIPGVAWESTDFHWRDLIMQSWPECTDSSDGSIPLHSSCDTWRNVQFDECHPAAVELARYQSRKVRTCHDQMGHIPKLKRTRDYRTSRNTGTDGHFKCCLYLLWICCQRRLRWMPCSYLIDCCVTSLTLRMGDAALLLTVMLKMCWKHNSWNSFWTFIHTQRHNKSL